MISPYRNSSFIEAYKPKQRYGLIKSPGFNIYTIPLIFAKLVYTAPPAIAKFIYNVCKQIINRCKRFIVYKYVYHKCKYPNRLQHLYCWIIGSPIDIGSLYRCCKCGQVWLFKQLWNGSNCWKPESSLPKIMWEEAGGEYCNVHNSND